METKYIFVAGGVVSGLGKGIAAASLGGLLKMRAFACGGYSYGGKRSQLQKREREERESSE